MDIPRQWSPKDGQREKTRQEESEFPDKSKDVRERENEADPYHFSFEPESNSDNEKTPKEKMKLTTEEISVKHQQFVEECCHNMRQMSQMFPPKLHQGVEISFSQEFLHCLKVVEKSFWKFDPYDVAETVVADYRQELGGAMVTSGTVHVLCDLLTTHLTTGSYVTSAHDVIKNESIFYVRIMLRIVWGYSDSCDKVKTSITQHTGFLPAVVHTLQNGCRPHLGGALSKVQDELLQNCLSILHNCGSRQEHVDKLRHTGTIKVILPYLESPDENIRLTTIATLADLVHEKEAELLEDHVAIFQFLIQRLAQALETDVHRDRWAWSVQELTRAIKQLARNDANKKILVDKGCLPSLVKILKKGNDDEVKESLGSLWSLSFDTRNKQTMVEERHLVKRVWRIYKKRSRDMEMKNSSYGVLWCLMDHLQEGRLSYIGGKLEKLSITLNTGLPYSYAGWADESGGKKKPEQRKGHVMLSYQWSDQQTILKICDKLRAGGMDVWIDVDYMEGSMLQTMAKAVEKCSIFIMSMSQRYKDSPNCRAEAEYAFQLRKHIIPLVMEQGYRPDGWLGIVLGSRLFYDFSGKYSFQSRIDLLVKAVLRAKEGEGDGDSIVKKPLPDGSPPLHTSQTDRHTDNTADRTDMVTWSQEEVRDWLAQHQLQHITSLSKLCGQEIVFMKTLKSEAPEFFYHYLKCELGVTGLLDLAKITEALVQL